MQKRISLFRLQPSRQTSDTSTNNRQSAMQNFPPFCRFKDQPGRQLTNFFALKVSPNLMPRITTPSNIGTISRIKLSYVPSSKGHGIDTLDICVEGSNLRYSSGDAISWNGQSTSPCAITNFTVNSLGEYYSGARYCIS